MRSFPIFTVLFLVLPIIEIFVLIKVGSDELLGPMWTIFLVVLTAVIGAFLLRKQGLSVLARLKSNMSQGKIPAQEIIEGMLLAVGGALLMTPGFVTDAMGFLCLLPFSRQFIAKNIIKRSAHKMQEGMSAQMGGFSYSAQSRSSPGSQPNSQRHSENQDPNIVEGEFTEIEEDLPELTNKRK